MTPYGGYAALEIREGDSACVFLGVNAPFILRLLEEKWKLVGECIVDGFLHGEAVASLD